MNQFATTGWEAHDAGVAVAGHRVAHPVRIAVGFAISAGGAVVLLLDILRRIVFFG